MKRFLLLVGVAAVAGAMYVAAAPGSRQSTAPTAAQFAALKKQVALLNRKLTALTKDEKVVKTAAGNAAGFIANCFLTTNAGVAPVTQFGDPNGTFGFAFTATVGAAPANRTALDIDAGATPQGYLQGVDPSCVSSSAASAAQMHVGSRLPLRAERDR